MLRGDLNVSGGSETALALAEKRTLKLCPRHRTFSTSAMGAWKAAHGVTLELRPVVVFHKIQGVKVSALIDINS